MIRFNRSRHLGRTMIGLALMGVGSMAAADTSTSASAEVTGTHFSPLLTYASDTSPSGHLSESAAVRASDGTVYSGAPPYPAVGVQRLQSLSDDRIQGFAIGHSWTQDPANRFAHPLRAVVREGIGKNDLPDTPKKVAVFSAQRKRLRHGHTSRRHA